MYLMSHVPAMYRCDISFKRVVGLRKCPSDCLLISVNVLRVSLTFYFQLLRIMPCVLCQ
jgi:hypothetical protein